MPRTESWCGWHSYSIMLDVSPILANDILGQAIYVSNIRVLAKRCQPSHNREVWS